ncbi:MULTISPECIES: PQQ-binding-like beta-propeller repeat protein [unclassified Streptomyces]|uniref:serine/threonine-protein kinase n=1 Tax=unclassified Streptomyces TaxID=2593676 RepID=UPI00035C869E|nr:MULTISPECIES: serine/threonine-protein kinase [unclassified Streptomyces]MYR65356.1 PQQ-binding-like beta-propeller repeat protein [Streptomyces sp. SID4939]MYT62621.1 PQQ-binding-like beta-propeller repeat protein [Streptomyces sp. SID8357]MYT89429.1 PQQ-binding-like beta-propeller repeat protein [Streptomyces sp. SID8360]PZX31543.1 serine/threonine protein kinase [Streptomyces sp. DvalAA-21]RAJ28298.1 serine/threonine protein kinase [Streptomyces sp. DpondAA-E10]
MPPLRGTGSDPEAEHPEYAGQYRLEACLGAGGMGVVHLARSASGLQLAVKVVHRRHAADPEFRARFRQEVAAARRVSGAFTAPVVDADPGAALPWMATLYVPGPTLSAQVKRNGPMSPAELRRLTAGLAEALRDIHRAGVVHRDLKPSNVLLPDSGPKVIDFGISRPYDSDLRTETGKLIGSPPYMAPEQFQRPREVGPAADVFALGAVLVHAATGRGPFDSDSPYIVAYQVVHDEADLAGVPADLAPLVARCLAKDPDLRPTPDEIMAALRPPSYEATAFIPAQRPPAPVESGVRTVAAEASTHVRAPDGLPSGADGGTGARRPARRLVVAAAALALLVAGGLWVAGTGDGPGAPEPAGTAERPAAFAPWRAPLRSADGSAPSCHASPAGADPALYCVATGFGTVRLSPADGGTVWSHGDTGKEALALGTGAGGTVYTARPGGELRAYAADGGAELWRAELSGYLDVPFPAGDVLLMGRQDGTAEGLDAATGASLWRHAVSGHPRPGYAWYDDAAGLAYLFEYAPDGATTLVTALDARTGGTAWQSRLDGLLTPAGSSGGALLLTSANERSQTTALVRYDPESHGTTRVALPFRMYGPSVAVAGDTVLLLERGGTLLAVDVRPGAKKAERWRLETAVGLTSAPVLGPDGGRLYFSAADGRLLAVDTARGTLLGQTRPRLRDGRLGHASSLPAPVVVGGSVVGTAPDGSVFAVDADDPARW